jgi:Na+-transporting methylmalonyl-CoA/oxaloacetate decarboxylase beta subunit
MVAQPLFDNIVKSGFGHFFDFFSPILKTPKTAIFGHFDDFGVFGGFWGFWAKPPF